MGRSLFAGLFIGSLISGVAAAACGGSSGASTGDDNAQAKVDFWNAFGDGDVAAVPAVRARLIATVDAHPQDDETPRLIGMSYALTQFEGASSPGATMTPPGGTEGNDMLSYLLRATTASPDPHRDVWNYTFYGGVLWGMASVMHDDAKVQQARDMLQQSATEFPVHGLFTLGSVLSRSARGTPDFQTAVDSYFKAMEVCTGAPLDRANPDVSRMLHGPFPDKVCGNFDRVPHNTQGELFLFADCLVKNNQPDAARPIYAAIQESDGYETWSFKAKVDERLATDLTAWAAKFDGTGEPTIGASPCLGCHQR